MSENENSDGGKVPAPFWESIVEGGLPQLLAGPAGKAISRLVGAAVEIPATYLDGIAQAKKDKTVARSQLSTALAEAVRAKVVEDPAVLERAVSNMLGRAYRVQENKEAVAKIAIESLAIAPPAGDGTEPTDEWMSKFERYVEDASSDDLRNIFGQILAEEIRSPGEVSAATMHFVAMLDSRTAQLIDRLLPYAMGGENVYIDCVEPPLSVVEKAYVEQSGFWSTGLTQTLVLGHEGQGIFPPHGETTLMVEWDVGRNLELQIALLSPAGKALAKVVAREIDFPAIAKKLVEKGASRVWTGRVIEPQGDKFKCQPGELIASSSK